jgi:hypothetical protein
MMLGQLAVTGAEIPYGHQNTGLKDWLVRTGCRSAYGDSLGREELGLVGAAAVVTAFVLIVGSGLRVAQNGAVGLLKASRYRANTPPGISSVLCDGGHLATPAITRITLPFAAYGGSSLLANFDCVTKVR